MSIFLEESTTEGSLIFLEHIEGFYYFKSLGFLNHNASTGGFDESTSFPKETMYKLIDGKFPFTTYEDIDDYINTDYTLQKVDINLKEIGRPIKVEVTGFSNSCYEGNFNKYGPCRIDVKIEAEANKTAANKPAGGKNKSNRRKSNRRKSNRRKSNRRR